jgi:hypothetical protein
LAPTRREGERAIMRGVVMLPSRGGEVVVRSRLPVRDDTLAVA